MLLNDTLLFLMRGITSNDFPPPLAACNFPAPRKPEKYEPKHHARLRRAAMSRFKTDREENNAHDPWLPFTLR
jgi:hypothetical protein